MAIELNDQNINRLIEGRLKFDEYKTELKNYPEKEVSLKQNLLFELAKLQFSGLIRFHTDNETLNIFEFDRCYRLRPIRDLNTTEAIVEDFCIGGSGCINRGYTSCLIVGKDTINCLNREPGFREILPWRESEMAKEHMQHARNLGISNSNLLLPHPLFSIGCHEVSPETHMPPHCNGAMVQIETPRFDLFWGMKKYIEFGNSINIVRENWANG